MTKRHAWCQQVEFTKVTGFDRNSGRLLQLTGYSIGSYVNACATVLPPSGWVTRGEYDDSGCRTGPNPSTGKNAWQLQRVS
ncbi:hypothetical protein [Kitasatospora sp. NPDC091207]|uniref:hypothetical protein n=1 Tax=Kitasatospora sp. NPDC091207 TaxID=3364083 RepID=UPI0037F1C9A7